MDKLKNKNGSVLAYALVITFVVLIITTSMLTYITSQIKFASHQKEKEGAFQVAEAGIHFYRWYLAHATSGKTAQQIADFWSGEDVIGKTSYTHDYNGIGEYTIDLVEAPSPSSTIVIVKSVGSTYKEPNLKRTVQVRLRRPSWSEFVFLSNSFMNFGSEAEVYGKVHSNTGIRFDGIAHNMVSSLVARFDDPTYGGNRQEFGVHTTVNPADPGAPSYPWASGTVPNRPDVFMGGRSFPVSEVNFSGVTTDFSNMKSEAQAGRGRYFDNSGSGRKILLKTDGTYDVCTVNSYNNNTKAIGSYLGIITYASGSYAGTNGNSCSTSSCCSGTSCPYIQSSRPARGRCVTKTNYNIINDGVIFIEDNAWVDGSINNKRVTIAAANISGGSPADIYIGTESTNLRVASFDCNNMIGLVAQQDVRVLGSCNDDYIVDAALLSQTGTVGINDNGFSGKNTLTFNGAIASYLQPYFQHGNSGFAVRFYNFNNDLLYCPPPYFPTGTEYFIDLWEEK